jgi:cytosine/adenosine deaminase-related metal-dependent hydrolase
MALLLQRVSGDPAGLSAEEALWLATRGGAQTLGRDDIGYLAPGMAADIAAYRLDTIDLAGGLHDPMAALVFCGPIKADWVIVNGKVRIMEGQFVDLELPALIQRHNAIARALVNGD